MGSIRKAQSVGGKFAQISNTLAQDARLSFRARGIILLVLSMPEDWHVTAQWLEEQGPDGRKAIRSALKELEQHRYFERVRRSLGYKQFDWTLTFSDEPLPPRLAEVSSDDGNSADESSAGDKGPHDFTCEDSTDEESGDPSSAGDKGPHDLTSEDALFPQVESGDPYSAGDNPADIPNTSNQIRDQIRSTPAAGASAPAADDEVLPANRILGDYIDWCGDAAPSTRTKGQLAKYIGEMVNQDKIPAKYIKQGLHVWHERGKSPSSLTSFVDEARRRAKSGKAPDGRSVGADPRKFTQKEYEDVGFKSSA